MSNTIGPIIAASAKLSVGYAEKLFQDIPAEKFGSFAQSGDRQIESNHPAFVCGHLCLYSPRIVQELGQDASSIEPPESYSSLFSKDAKCQDDPDNTLYPAADELKSQLIAGYNRVAEVLLETPDDVFLGENPTEGLRSRFPTKGSAHAFYVGGHFMLHLGQMSAWRRAMGLAPA